MGKRFTRKYRVLSLILITSALLLVASAFLLPTDTAYANKDVFRVAYIEGDPYVNYAGYLSGLVMGLAEEGFVDPVDGWGFSEGSDDAGLIWSWLKDHSGQEIEFVQSEFYSLISMTEEEKKELVRHLNQDKPVDLVLVMGTAAAKFVRQNGIQGNAMIMSVTNAYQAGIVEGIEYSGIPNVWAHMSPNRYYNQLNVFYDLFRFQRVGIVYEDSETGRNEISYQDIRQFARDKGIALVEVPVSANQSTDGPEAYEAKMIEAYHSLAGKVDAVYLTNSGFRTASRIPEYLAPFYQAGIPVFSQTGKNDVSNGATMTIFRYGFTEIGAFCADRFINIKNGEQPGDLEQGYDETQAICFNITAAEQAGVQIPFKALLSADTIYTKIGE